VLPRGSDTYLPLRPKPRSNRSKTGDSVSSTSELHPVEAKGYDASISDDLDNTERDDNRSTMRPPPRQQPMPIASPSAIPTSAASFGPQSPPDMTSPIRPPLGDVPPLQIHKRNQAPALQPPSQSKAAESDRIGIAQSEDRLVRMRAGSDTSERGERSSRPSSSQAEQPDSRRQALRKDVKQKFDISKPRHWKEHTREDGSRMDGSDGSQDWVIVDRDSRAGEVGNGAAHPRTQPHRPRERDPRRSPGRYHPALGRPIHIPNPPRGPAPQPPVESNDGRGPSRIPGLNDPRNNSRSGAGQAVWTRMMAKSMQDLRAQYSAGGSNHPATLIPGSAKRNPLSPSRPPPPIPVPGMLPKSSEGQRGMSPTVVRVRPLPPHSGSPSTAANLPFSSSTSSVNTTLQPVGTEPYPRPTSAVGDRIVSPASNRLQNQRHMQSPTHWTDAGPIQEDNYPVRSPLPQSRPIPSQPTSRPSTASRTLQPPSQFHALNDSHTESSNGAPRAAGTPPRSPSSPLDPRLPAYDIDNDYADRTLRQDQQAKMLKILEASPGSDSTLIAPMKPKTENKQLPPLPPPPLVPPPRPAMSRQPSTLVKSPPNTGSVSSLIPFNNFTENSSSKLDDDDDDDDTGTSLWLERPKSVFKGSAASPLRTDSPATQPLSRNPLPPASSSPKPPPGFPPPPVPSHLGSQQPGTNHVQEPFRTAVDFARPPPEDVYERLDTYFPAHNLDEPVIEAASGGTSPTSADNPVIPLPSAPLSSKGFHHKKSIRVVAAEHKRRIDRTSRMQTTSSAANDMMRTRSTKLWGSKLEEVTPAQDHSMISVPESPTANAPKRT
jgi:hypothetical protein